MTIREQMLVEIALKLKLTPTQAVILPAAFDKTCQMVSFTADDMFEALMSCQELADYIRKVIVMVAEGIPVEAQGNAIIQRLK